MAVANPPKGLPAVLITPHPGSRAAFTRTHSSRRLHLRDEFNVYEPEETGVGCADHDDPKCLCDIPIGPYPPVGYATDEVLMGKVSAEIMDGINLTGAELCEWACNMLALYALAKPPTNTTKARMTRKVREDVARQYNALTYDDIRPLVAARWRYAQRTEVGALVFKERQNILRSVLLTGMSYEEVGAEFGITGSEVARHANPTLFKKLGFEAINELRTELLETDVYYGLYPTLAPRFGISAEAVRKFAVTMRP